MWTSCKRLLITVMPAIRAWTSAPTLAKSTTLPTAATSPTWFPRRFPVFSRSCLATIPQLDGVKARANPLVHPIHRVHRLPPAYCLHLRSYLPHLLKSLLQKTVSSAGHILAAIPTMCLVVRSLGSNSRIWALAMWLQLAVWSIAEMQALAWRALSTLANASVVTIWKAALRSRQTNAIWNARVTPPRFAVAAWHWACIRRLRRLHRRDLAWTFFNMCTANMFDFSFAWASIWDAKLRVDSKTPRNAICRLQQLYIVETLSVFNTAEASLIDIRWLRASFALRSLRHGVW